MSVCFIIPPHIFREISKNGSEYQKQCAKQAIEVSEKIRAVRQTILNKPHPRLHLPSQSDGGQASPLLIGEGNKNRIIYTADNTTDLPGDKVRSEGQAATNDQACDQAYYGTGATFDLYSSAYKRNSIDNKGLNLISTVHYSKKYDNAFWDGNQMVYGDGDGDLFGLFTKPIDVTGHELTHGVTQYSANLEYEGQSGALNESFSDVFGSLVKQQVLNQTATQADWLIGEGIFTNKVKGKALRSMREPGSAYDDPVLGKDPQPGDMGGYVQTQEDNGGVHINSGIPNHAFALAAVAIGDFAWKRAGMIWYKVLTEKLRSDSNFADCAKATIEVADELFGEDSREIKAVQEAWKTVGVI